MNIELLAAAPSGQALKDFLEVITYLAVLGVAIRALLKKSPGHSELATKTEVKHLEDKVEDGMKSLRKEMKDDDDGLHRRVGAISVKLATVDGKLDTANNNLNMLLQKEVGK